MKKDFSNYKKRVKFLNFKKILRSNFEDFKQIETGTTHRSNLNK